MGGVPERKEYTQTYAHPIDHPDESEWESERLAPDEDVDDLIAVVGKTDAPTIGFGGRTL